MRLAFFTPLSPQKSGVADYSEELLPHLGRLADIDVVVGDYQPSSPDILRGFRVIRSAQFLAASSSYDAAVYQVANNLAHHGYMIPCLEQAPGILVLHDCCLDYLMLGLTLRQGDLKSLQEILRPAHGDRSGRLAKKLLFGLLDS
ncbi:MAG: hypothetical protein AAB654_12250, partial [Acidobacteriota bacterium]